MKAIRAFWKSNKPLRQVVGNTTASQLLPTVTHLVWRGKNCFGVTMRDIQYLLRDPFASKDISSRLALRYRGTTSEESTQVWTVVIMYFLQSHSQRCRLEKWIALWPFLMKQPFHSPLASRSISASLCRFYNNDPADPPTQRAC